MKNFRTTYVLAGSQIVNEKKRKKSGNEVPTTRPQKFLSKCHVKNVRQGRRKRKGQEGGGDKPMYWA